MTLTNFEKLKILRDQREDRTKELSEITQKIKELQKKIDEQRYLEGLSPYYSMNNKNTPAPEEISKLKEEKTILEQLISTIDTEIPATLKMAQHLNEENIHLEKTVDEGTARKASFDF